MHPLLALDVPASAIPPTNAAVSQAVPLVNHGATANSQTVYDTLGKIGTNTINIFLYVAGAVLLGSIIIHSITLMSSGGNETAVASAKKGLTNAVIGLLLVTLTFLVMNAIIGILAPT